MPDLSLGLVGVLDGLGSVLGWLLGGLCGGHAALDELLGDLVGLRGNLGHRTIHSQNSSHLRFQHLATKCECLQPRRVSHPGQLSTRHRETVTQSNEP